MTETAPGMTPPHETPTPKRASHVRIILMLALGGPVLAVGGCALFLANLNLEGSHHGSDGLSAAGGILFVAGCLAFGVGCIWAIAYALLRRSDRATAAKQAGGSADR